MDLVSRGVVTTFSSVVIKGKEVPVTAPPKDKSRGHAGPRGRRLMLDCGMPFHVDGHP